MQNAKWLFALSIVAAVARVATAEVTVVASARAETPAARPAVAYLGVATSRVPEALAAQLALPKGFGLCVDYVAPGSPAHDAGLRKHDVLLRFADQHLVNPDQLAVLVAARKTGDKVDLDVLREGKEKTLSVVLGRRPDARTSLPLSPRIADLHVVLYPDHSDDDETPPSTLSILLHGGHTIRVTPDDSGGRHMVVTDRDGRTVFEGPVNTSDQRDAVPDPFRRALDHADRMRSDTLRRAREAARDHAPTEGPTASSASEMAMADGQHTLKVRTEDGRKRLTVTNADGTVVFDGPINTPDQRAALPDAVRAKLERLENARRNALDRHNALRQRHDLENDDL